MTAKTTRKKRRNAEHSTPPPVAAPTLYDSEAPQHVPVLIPDGDEACEVVLVTRPVADGVYKSYSAMCKRAAGETGEEDERQAAPARQRAAVTAEEFLFNSLTADIEGFEEGEEKPEDWRDIFGPQEKGAILANSVFRVVPQLSPPKKAARPSWKSELRNVTTRFSVFFDGHLIEVSHTLKKSDAEQHAEFKGWLQTSDRPGDVYMAELATLYAALHVSHEGYKGRVPMPHKSAAVYWHMMRMSAVLTKN